MKRKRVVMLGATGSIGESARKIARDIPDRMQIVGLAANSSASKLAEQAKTRPSRKATKPGPPLKPLSNLRQVSTPST